MTYDRDGEAQELPYQYVPSAFREWGAVPKDWHTQCSTLADESGLLVKLKRLYPIVGELLQTHAVMELESSHRNCSFGQCLCVETGVRCPATGATQCSSLTRDIGLLSSISAAITLLR